MSSYLEINLNSLEKTYKTALDLYKKDIIFVIKSNAYGLGLKTIAHFAYHILYLQRFACASAKEAFEILEAIPDFQGTIYLLSLHISNHSKFYICFCYFFFYSITKITFRTI